MSKEIISQGNPFAVEFRDREFGKGASKSVINADETGLKLGGRTVLGDPSVSVGALTANKVQVTFQLNDCLGNPHLAVRRVFVWVSATPGATSVGTSTTGLTTSVDTGVAITAVSGNLTVDCLTDATGKLVIGLTDAAGAETRYVNFAVDDKIFSSAAVVTS
jgi:hypothetical protein